MNEIKRNEVPRHLSFISYYISEYQLNINKDPGALWVGDLVVSVTRYMWNKLNE
jgi:hypothetical protein